MEFPRLERLHRWLLWLLITTTVALIAVVALGVSGGWLSRAVVSERLAKLFTAPERIRPHVALISGHRGYDTGAICDDGLMEVTVNEQITAETARLLRDAGILVQVLDEYDSALQGLRVDALVSLHADSCVPLSGFKVASPEETLIPEKDKALRMCLEQQYAAETGLPIHPATATSDMYGYHAFQRIANGTPAAIIETGFLGGDRALLTDHADMAARGVAAGIICFLNETWNKPAAAGP